MKAIAIQAPFASFIAMGIIDVWNMPFKTDYRGRVLIVADKPRETSEQEDEIPVLWHHILYNNDLMHNMGDIFYINLFTFAQYPFGEVVGYVDIVDSSDNPSDFMGNPWYQGGIAWRFANPHFCEPDCDDEINVDIPDTCGFFDIPKINGKQTRFYEEGKPIYPYIKDDELFIQQSFDAYYRENEDDCENETSTIWYYADDPYMQLALTGKIGGTEILPFKILNHKLEQHEEFSRHRIIKTYIEPDCNGDLCFCIKYRHVRHYELVTDVENEKKQDGSDVVYDSYNVQTDGDFKSWVKQHQTVKGISIEGVLDIHQVKMFDIISKLKDKYIDINKLSLNFDADDYQDEYDYLVNYFELYYKGRGERFPLILTLIANRKHSNQFLVHQFMITSADKKVAVYVYSFKKSEKANALAFSKIAEHVGNFACQGMAKVKSVTIPYKVKTIGDYAFEDCEDLYDVVFPEHLEKLGKGAFAWTDIEDVVIPEGVKEIPEECFFNTHLLTVKIPHSVKKICNMAFTLYDLQETLKIPEGVEEIEYQALEGVEKVIFPSTLTKLDDSFYYEECCDNGENKPYIEIQEANPVYYSKNGKIYEHGHVIQYIPYRKDKYKGEEFMKEKFESSADASNIS
jgi:hypothetical protein